jgi:hypothetical protein
MAKALLKTTLKRCGGSSLQPPKDILEHCTGSLNVTRTVLVLAGTSPKPFAGTGSPKQRVILTLQRIWRGWALNSRGTKFIYNFFYIKKIEIINIFESSLLLITYQS